MLAPISKSRLIPAAILAIFVYGLIAAMLGTLLPELSRKYGLTPDQNGGIALAQAIGLIIASLAVGPLIDNKGKKTGLLLGLGLIAASLFVVPNSPAGGLKIVFLALGVGGGIIVTAANALVSDISEERRATTLNLLNLFFGLGGLATPLIGAYVLAGNTIALCYLVAVLTVATFLLHAVTPMPPPTGERGFKLGEAGQLLGRPILFLLSLLLFLYVTCEVGVWNWLPRHLVAQGIPESRALGILSLGFALGLLVGRVVVSRILIKVSSPTVTLAASILMAITTYAMLQTKDPFLAGILVFCAGYGPRFPHHPGHGRRRLPENDRHRHGARHHLRLDRPGSQLPHHRRDRRRRPLPTEDRAPGNPLRIRVNGAGDPGDSTHADAQEGLISRPCAQLGSSSC